LLFYSLPTLRGLLMEDYYQHYALLVVAIWLLLQSSISQEDVNDAERLLTHFCLKFSFLYGNESFYFYPLPCALFSSLMLRMTLS